MKQVARQLTDCDEGFLNGKKYLIMDRDSKFFESVRNLMHDEQIKPRSFASEYPQHEFAFGAVLRFTQV